VLRRAVDGDDGAAGAVVGAFGAAWAPRALLTALLACVKPTIRRFFLTTRLINRVWRNSPQRGELFTSRVTEINMGKKGLLYR
jgi:hypothetical protein